MKSHRKITARVKQRKLDNPSGFKYLKHDNLSMDAIPEFDEGGTAHNATIHPHGPRNQVNNPYDLSTVPGVGTNIPGYTEPTKAVNPNAILTKEMLAEDAAWLAQEAEQDNVLANRVSKDTAALKPVQAELDAENLNFDAAMVKDNTSNPYLDIENMEQEPDAPGVKALDNKQFFNPYGGVDVMGAANVFGQELGKPKGERSGLSMIGAGLKVATGLGRSMAAGAGYAKRNQFAVNELNEKRRSGMIGDYQATAEDGGFMHYEDGGESTQNSMGMEGAGMEENKEMLPELLTGDYSTGTENGPQNIEVEVNEYIKTPDGNVTKVLGDDHENGGEGMNVEEGSQIISDNLQPTKEQVEKLNETYGLKSKGKDTYAKVMDKFYNVIGLKDLIEEEAGIIKSIKDQTEKSKERGADESTFQVNLEFLSSRLKDISDEKKPLQEQAAGVFDEVFQMQESTKPEPEVQREFKIGGTVYSEKDILEIAKTNNLDKDRAFEILKNFSNGTSYAENGMTKRTGPKLNPTESKAAFKEWAEHLREQGYEGEINENAKDLGDEAGKIQKWMVENKPEAVVDYFKNNAITAKGIRALQAKDKKLFTNLGIDPNKAPGLYTAKEKRYIQGAARKSGLMTREFILDQFNDNLWDYRAPLLARPKVGENPNIKRTGTNELVPLTTKQDELNVDTNRLDELANLGEGEREEFTDDRVAGKEVYLLPDQSPLPPLGMQPHLKAKRRFGRMDAQQITPDAQLTELNRGSAAAMEQINKLPSGQREAALIQLQANKQSQASELMSKTEAANAQFKQTADAFNIRQGDREEEAKWADLLNYEQRSLGALANTEDDYRRYFNEGQKRNVDNFNQINSLNLMNAAYENFNVTNDGVEVTGDGLNLEDMIAAQKFNQVTARPATNTSKKKRKGGTVKRGRKKQY